jgi:Telomeric single stranded DNA binding POT1/CDC13
VRRQEAIREPELIGLYGVVLGFGTPRRTKRGDWFVSATLVDDSFPLGDDSTDLLTVNINMFNSDRNRLPDLRYAGDVVRIHRAKVEEFKGEIQLVGLKLTSYVVFRGDSEAVDRDDRWSVSAVAKGYMLSSQDKELFTRIWRWGQQRIFSFPTLKVDHCTQICDMLRVDDTQSVEGDRDFTLMVCSISTVPQDPSTGGVTPRGILRVWDGTGFPISDPVPELLPPSLANLLRSSGDPPSVCLERLAQITRRIGALKDEFKVPAPRSLTGRVVNVAIWEDAHWELVAERSAVKVGSFIRLRNVRESVLHNTNIRCINVSAMSYLTPLPDLTFEVRSLTTRVNLVRCSPSCTQTAQRFSCWQRPR